MTWQDNIRNLSLSTSHNNISSTCDSVFIDLREEKQIDLTDIFIPINPYHLSMVLRTTYSLKRKVLGWEDSLLICLKQCKLDGINYHDLLFGLISKNAP